MFNAERCGTFLSFLFVQIRRNRNVSMPQGDWGGQPVVLKPCASHQLVVTALFVTPMPHVKGEERFVAISC